MEQRQGLLLVPSVGLTAVPGGSLKNPRPADFPRGACVRIEPSDRAGLERLLGYCTRPAFALERTDEQRRWCRLPKPRPEGRTTLRLTPLESIQRLAAP